MQSKKQFGSVEDTSNSNSTSKELIKREDVKNSPFTVVSTDKGCFGSMGKYRITEVYENTEEVKEELKEITWNRVIQVTMLLIEMNQENNFGERIKEFNESKN